MFMYNLDQEFTKKIKRLEENVYNNDTARQQYIADWLELVPFQFSYSNASTINISGFDARNIFAIGDRLELTQNSITKYFYIYGVANSSLSISGGDDYTYTNNTITKIRYSKNVNPQGFPESFAYQPTWSSNSGSVSSTDDVNFIILGNSLRLLFEDLNFTPASTPDVVYMTLPFNVDNTKQNTFTLQKCIIRDVFDVNNTIASLELSVINDRIEITHQFGTTVPMKASFSQTVNIDISYYF